MSTVFLSYSRRDYFFAEMLAIKLEAAGLKLWRDQDSIRAGDDWRHSIESGIAESLAVVVALSSESAESPYVTYEWAYAIGMGKTIVPVKLSDCTMHPRLEVNQYIDFSYPRALPWNELIQRLQDTEGEAAAPPAAKVASARKTTPPPPGLRDEILGYLNSKGYTAASFDRLQTKLPSKPNEQALKSVLLAHPETFRGTTVKFGLPGLAKRVP